MPISILPYLLMSMPGAGAVPEQPIQLQIEHRPSQIVLTVVGASSVPVSARYDLATDIGGNRARQSGQARLIGATPVQLIRLAVGEPAGAAWQVRLTVTREDGTSYAIERSSAQP
ncbi:MAG TPA: curli-like amyloid fiber formation chaperone CsgH [Sphingomonas sp.]|jgi:hypothetical protein|nr:curli-like amyloid fiber formation chaperone CsgH [Sphingomonas sp.]